ncbi:MAG: hypothetical protein AB7H71_14085 [Alphaproteobacteria bacterium]
MKAREVASDPADIADDLFEMANLFPHRTGLPMTVWVSPRAGARHDVRIKVNLTHGNQMNAANTAVVGVRPLPHLIAGRLTPDDERLVFEWVALNTDALIAYWEGQIDTIDLGERLAPITSMSNRTTTP